ncbi:hypothetical protein BDZ89DRAFT_1063388 [Hymenopellis radicata]|nr:hypothetical protein BDZ89DRAFT_1063388 [Hymenopellis radicata]
MADSNAKYCANCSCILLQPGKETGRLCTARIEELLRQNDPPLDVELPDCHKTVEDARATLEDLDAQIFQAQQLLSNLLSARQRAQSHFEDAKSLLHPMRSIPGDLLAEIFGYCVGYHGVDDPDALDPRAAPWLLTRVSRRWRELAVNLPQLWIYLWLDFDKHIGCIPDHRCAYRIGLFTERSKGLPMSVYLGGDGDLKHYSVLPALEVSIPRWQYLQVDLPRSTLQRLSGNNFSMLEAIYLHYDTEDEWHLNLDVFNSACVPVLRSVTGPITESWQALEHVVFPWSQLTSIPPFPAFEAVGLNVLRTMADLEELRVVALSVHTPIHNVVSLSKLRRLEILESAYASGRGKQFFSTLTVPVLTELTLVYVENSVPRFPISPLPLGNLTKLIITYDMDSHVENTVHLFRFFTLTHHVESLRLYNLSMTVELAEGLNLDKITDELPSRLPCLQFLDIGDCEYALPGGDYIPFFEMLYSRLPAVRMVEGKWGAEETGNAYAGNGQSAATRTEIDPRSRLDSSEDHRRCLKWAQIPRRLYVQMRRDWPGSFLQLASMVDLECGVAIEDIDS